MRVIYKYELNLQPEPITKILLPEGSIARHVGVVDLVVYLWVEQSADVAIPKQEHTFIVRGTGHGFEYEGKVSAYVGTVFQGPFVWHIYHNWE